MKDKSHKAVTEAQTTTETTQNGHKHKEDNKYVGLNVHRWNDENAGTTKS